MDFKVPSLPVKRKPNGDALDPFSSSSSMNKRPRASYSSSDPLSGISRSSQATSSSSSSGGRSANSSPGSKAFPTPSIPLRVDARKPSVDEVQDEEGPQLPGPAEDSYSVDADGAVGDETYEADDGDEEGGRFFGGGTNETQERILDIFAGVEDLNSGSGLPTLQELRRQILKFQRTVDKNMDMRSRYADDPEKYLDSEADLDRAFTFLLPLTQNPIVYYPELTSHETLIPTLTSLLAHENTDIALQCLNAIYELTDEDTGEDLVEEEEDEDKRDELAKTVRLVVGEFIQALLDNSLLELLIPNLERLDEEQEESDRTGIFNIIGILENLLAFLPPLAGPIVEQTKLLPWLLKRVTVPAYDSNKQYASELLSILTQEDRDVRLRVGSLEGVDTLLQVMAQYRKRDPDGAEETEFMENIFDTLCSILNEPENKIRFLESEGNELMILMLKEKKMARSRAIKVLDYALQTEDGEPNCVRFVEGMGLKSLFNTFMGRGKAKLDFEDDEHLLSIISSLFSNLGSDTPERVRLLAKFVENEYEKIDRLLEMRENAETRMIAINREIQEERALMEANDEEITEVEIDDWYLRRINSGLAHLQNADYCLAWMIMEDDGAAAHAKMLLSRRGKSIKDVIATLREMRAFISSDNLEALDRQLNKRERQQDPSSTNGDSASSGEPDRKTEDDDDDKILSETQDDPATREKVMILTQLMRYCESASRP